MLFSEWCSSDQDDQGRKHYWTLSEKNGGREAIQRLLARTVRSHYDRLERIADDIARLGYEGAATILSTAMPTKARSRSGDLGEILATELVEEKMELRVPVRRLRYKDGREMAMRGDDFIGAGYAVDGKLRLLKGEAKSNMKLNKATITSARKVLNRDHGRCTPDSLLSLPIVFLKVAMRRKRHLVVPYATKLEAMHCYRAGSDTCYLRCPAMPRLRI
jgi:hypothetical protein